MVIKSSNTKHRSCLYSENLSNKYGRKYLLRIIFYSTLYSVRAWSGVNWADLMAAQGALGTDFYNRTIVGMMLWTEYRPVIKIGPKGALGSNEIRPIHSTPSLGQSIPGWKNWSLTDIFPVLNKPPSSLAVLKKSRTKISYLSLFLTLKLGLSMSIRKDIWFSNATRPFINFNRSSSSRD